MSVRFPRTAIVLAAAASLLGAGAGRAAAQDYFGQNMVEYHRFDWQVIETEHFLIYYYPSERHAAVDVAQLAERAYARLSRVFGWEFREKKPILLFASRADFGENTVTGDLGEGTGGVTEFQRHRMLFFFTGNYRTTEHVLTHEMVHEFQYDIFAHGRAGNGAQALQAVNPPLWFMEGMAEYLSKGPDDPHTNVIMRDAALNKNVPTLAQMTNQPNQYFPYRYGESFWAYVGRRWGDEAVGAIMLQTPNLGVERAFERETGKPLASIGADWKVAIQDLFLPQAAQLSRARTLAEPLLTKHRTGGDVFLDPSLSPDGKYIVFLSNGNPLKGQVFIDLWLADAKTGKRIKRLIKSTIDPNYEEIGLLYSQVSFSPDGSKLAFSALSGGQEVLDIFDVERRKRLASLRLPLDGLTGPSWSPDGKQLVFSGAKGGITDLYTVDADGSNLTQLMSDKNGDAQPQWSPDGKTIAFSTERGPGTHLPDLIFPKLRIALYHLDTRQIEVLPNQTGQNINPNWSPDGSTIAYVSNRTGIPNIYLYDLASRTHSQITNFVGGVTAVTDVSPALSWAHAADRLAFVYYEDGKYTIWTLDDPLKLPRIPVPEPRAALAAAAADTTHKAPAPAAGEPSAAYYNGLGGFRPAATLPRPADQPPEEVVSVAALLDTGAVKLADTSSFFYYPYKLKISPDYVSTPTVGYSQNNFGSGFYGGATIFLSDMTGATRLAFSGAVNGRLEDFQIYAAYTYLGSRLQYQFGILNQPFYFSRGTAIVADSTTGGADQVSVVTRYLQRAVFATGLYPLNRFDRFELGVQLTSLNQQDQVFTVFCDPTLTICPTSSLVVVDQKTTNYVQPMIAYVSDNTLFGYFAPIYGRRYRFQIEPALGGYQFITYSADYRKYESIIFNKLIVALHLQGAYATGRDADLFQRYIAYPDAVRGYDGSNFLVSQINCPTTDPNQAVKCNPAVGSNAVWGNFEIRAPIYRGGEGSVVPIPPIEFFVFADAGTAWFQGQTVHWNRSGNYDPSTDRSLLTSTGAGVRVNLFGAAILSWAYVMPHDTPIHTPYWLFSLYPPF
jgi:Tol biopolymer transport system component